MSALFNFNSLFRLLILIICTTTYIRKLFPSMLSKQNKGVYSFFYKTSVIGERLSPYISLMAMYISMKMLKSIIF
ncbi:hypothetical protein SLOPH_2736 [Spraguea lophii 42_110]|uniref:Protein kish n=1 Tax=Spraguea lophii (strain 42_110) TaxID=1358809 RepID=S7XSF6_SPRLO|nr:hypothetical protein SLOPH_2736 [Spraguea lophii 42_110]